MPTTKKTLKALRDGLRVALALAAKARDREDGPLRLWHDGRAEGIRTAIKLVEELCK